MATAAVHRLAGPAASFSRRGDDLRITFHAGISRILLEEGSFVQVDTSRCMEGMLCLSFYSVNRQHPFSRFQVRVNTRKVATVDIPGLGGLARGVSPNAQFVFHKLRHRSDDAWCVRIPTPQSKRG